MFFFWEGINFLWGAEGGPQNQKCLHNTFNMQQMGQKELSILKKW